MPSKTFLNLSIEKREKIRQAAIKEFSSVSFEKVSINRIIKDANISRGSFYMYFEDIYDLAIYLMEDSKKQVLSQLLNNDSVKNGLLDEVILVFNSVIYDYYNLEENVSFFKNFMVYFQGMPEDKMRAIKGIMQKSNDFSQLIDLLDKSQFKNQTEEYIKNVVQLGFILFRNVVLQTVTRKLSKEESQKILKESLEVLKNGYGGCTNA